MALRIGIVGAGIHGARYMKHVAEDVPGLKLAAACRRDAEALAPLCEPWGCRPLTDAAELIASPEVDAVVVATPPSSHFDLVSRALAAGKPALVEKPITGTLAEARELARLAEAPGAPSLMVAQTLRWNPVLLRAKELMPELGPIRYLRLSQRLEPTALPWQRDRALTVGGSVLLTGVHLFDTARFLSGREFTEVRSQQESWRNPAVEDFFLAHAHLDDGCHVSLEVSKFGPSRGCLLEAVGEAGQLQAEYYHGGLMINRGAERREETVDAATPTLPAVLSAWRDSLKAGSPPPVGVEDGVRTLEVVEACYESHRLGRSITLG